MTSAVQVEITDEKALATLREVIAERPEYVYSCPSHMQESEGDPSCYYTHVDETSDLVSAGCAVGVALHRLGFSLQDLSRYEGATAYDILTGLAPGLSKRTREIFNDVQMNQDSGAPWGLAYAKATGETI